MKFEKLIIQNLNSIEEAEIVFSQGILAKEPLFLICGTTGSGKTTILDAITLALYDKVSRYENVMNEEPVEGGITTQNPYNILRKGKFDGKAELHFSVNGTYYIATWSVHKTRNNTYSGANRRSLAVCDGEKQTVILDKITQVNKKIEELVGLTYEQFVRSVMLAQGEFNTFLISDRAKQSEILEKLTGTEVYSKIADVIRLRKNEASQKKKNAKSECDSLEESLLPEEKMRLLEEQKLELENGSSEIESLLRQMEDYLDWIAKDKALKDEYDNAKYAYDNILNQIDSKEYKETKSFVEDYFSTSKIRERLNELQHDETEINKLNMQFEDDASLLSSLKFSLQNERRKKLELEKQKSDLSNWIESHRDDEMMCQNINLILGALKEMSQIQLDKKNKEMKLQQEELKKNDINISLNVLRENIEVLRRDKALADNMVDELLANFNSDEQNRLIEEYRNKNLLKQKALDRISHLKNIRTILEQYLNLDENIKNNKLRLDGLKSLSEEKSVALHKAKVDFDTYDLEFQKQKNMVEEWAKTLRSMMKEGEACPVCGSKVLYYNDENVVDSLYSSIKNEWDRLRAVLEQMRNELNKIDSEVNVLTRGISSDEKNLQLLFENLNERCNGRPVFELRVIDSAVNKHKESVVKYDEEIESLDKKLNELALVKNKIELAQSKKKAVDEKLTSIEQQKSEKQNELQMIESELIAIKTKVSGFESGLADKKASVDGYLNMENWEKLWDDDSFAFTEMLKESAKTWNKNTETLRELEIQSANLDNIISQCERYLSLIVEIIPEWENIGMKKSYIEEEKIVPYFLAVNERLRERLSRKSALENKIIILKKEIDDFISHSYNIDYERLKALDKISDIQTVAQKNRRLDDEFIKAQQALKIKHDDWDSHQKDDKKPTDDLMNGDIVARRTLLLEDKKAKEKMLLDINTALAMDKQNHSKTESKRILYEKIVAECELWEQLAKSIGATEGNNFRDVAQAYTMGMLLERANYYMSQLSSRYRLYNNTDSLAILVQDLEMGGVLRAASTLSGGETFLVSLALALGLTSINDEHFNTDMLFIDEGFGTLDSDSLDMVMNTLENLHNIGRRVGIISHVDALKERIPAKIQLVREGKSASRVEIVRN
ncbi:MAG: AAA family ATPase [Bacteroidales bacterium]|nr:AAA family ATPase [Bacteroidales bacterium]